MKVLFGVAFSSQEKGTCEQKSIDIDVWYNTLKNKEVNLLE